MMNFTDIVITDLQVVSPVVPAAALTWGATKLASLTDVALMILQVVSPVLVAALTWGAAKLASFIRSKVANEYLRGVLVRLDDAVVTAVKDLQQTVVDELKAASADGKISEAEKRRIKVAAVTNVKGYLGTKGIRVLAEVLGLSGGALDSFLGSKVEAVVHDLRLAERAVSASSAPKSVTESPRPLASTPA